MEDRLRELIISVTSRCNLRCVMCGIPNGDTRDALSTAALKFLISDAVKLNPSSIVFSGGEPLLREDIFELIAFVNQRKVNTCLTSNGSLINEDRARLLAASGVGVVNISIEGPKEIHDLLRGKDNFEKVITALENLKKHKIETTIATIVCRQNYRSLAYVLELARAYSVTTVKFQPFSEIFLEDKDAGKGFFAQEKDLSGLKQAVEEVIRLANEYKISTNPESYLRKIPPYLCGSLGPNGKHGCSALWSSCPVSAGGDVYPCWVLSGKPLGNITDKKISDIWNSREHNRIRHLITQDGCGGCLMSCYDYNFGYHNLVQMFSLKAHKLSRPKLYKRFYYRAYQYIRYFSGKLLKLLLNKRRQGVNEKQQTIAEKLKEIRAAKEILRKAAESFKE